ncbi:5-methyltetrahydropteroyltriglutamate--homocysteine S-methyltransferase [Pseudochelatococcus lubricantis]|uniref:5-methyltetrahydropteroyltriglutamate-- homocysteine S-methyltransferase n=1 Tax=Pseudochelatococcus lubricantis TaxID=1538102 RepID=UPI0035ED04E2
MSHSAEYIKNLRVDHVGSLLRPQALKDAFREHRAGALSAGELRARQDEAIAQVVREQVDHGLPIVNDGEYRRQVFLQSFSKVAGFEEWENREIPKRENAKPADVRPAEHTHDGACCGYSPVPLPLRRATRRLELVNNDILDEYAFVKGLTDTPAKVTLIGVDRIIHGYGKPQPQDIYPSLQAFIDDLVRIQRELIAGVAAAGCRYVSIDEPSLTGYVDPASIAEQIARGEDPAQNLSHAIAADNAAIAGHEGVVFGVHLCRGNRQSLWHREGFYDGIAERLFNELNFDRFLLEYDTPRAGSFAPLRFVPKGKIVVLGLITTKVGELETADGLIRRIEEASQYIPVEQLALSPQCGFASVIEGNLLTPDEQWRKIDLMLDVARRVWH